MKVEQVFGAVAILALLVVGAFALTGGGGAKAQSPVAATAALVLTGDAAQDTCTCYEEAFRRGQSGAPITGTAYEAGYGACRQYAGEHGGAAWSWGYSNGSQGLSAKRSCRAYQAMVRG